MADNRFLRTDYDIQRNFILLLQSKDYNDITVSLLVERSLITRPTFYDHYDNLYDLSQTIIKDSLQPFIEILEQAFDQKEKRTEDSYKIILPKLSQTLLKERDKYLSIRRIPLGKNSFDEQLKEQALAIFDPYLRASNKEFEKIILSNILLGNIDYMLKTQRIPTFTEFKNVWADIFNLMK